MPSVLGGPKGSGAPFSARKLEVLKAAAKLFNRRGFHNTTMDDIAATLHVTKPALYYYAKSKDDMLFEIGSIALTQASQLLTQISSTDKSGAAQLRDFFQAWTISICEEFGRCLVLTKPESLEPGSRKKSKLGRRRVQSQVHQFIDIGQQDGSIRQTDTRLLAQFLFDLHNGITYWYHPKGAMTPQQIAEYYWDTLCTGIVER